MPKYVNASNEIVGQSNAVITETGHRCTFLIAHFVDVVVRPRYVKLTLFTDGKKVKSHKTEIAPDHVLNPTFNHQFPALVLKEKATSSKFLLEVVCPPRKLNARKIDSE